MLSRSGHACRSLDPTLLESLGLLACRLLRGLLGRSALRGDLPLKVG
jgi:hypothetical protein